MADFVDVTFNMFFDRPGVMAKVKDGTKSVLSQAGAYIRRDAKSSIKQAVSDKTAARRRAQGAANDGRVGTPGGPPRSHTGRLRDLIFFGYDENGGAFGTVVVGPKLFRQQNPTAPHSLEFGGDGLTAAGKRAKYRAYPFMNPAMQKNVDKFAGLFAGAIKG